MRLQNIQARANRQLGDTGQLTRQAERYTNAYTRALKMYGADAERTLALDRARRLELDRTSGEIARQGGLLKVLRDEGEATRRTFAGIGLQPGGGQMLGSSAINLSQQAIASGGSLDAVAVAGLVQAPEILQALSISGPAAAAAITGVTVAMMALVPVLQEYIREQRKAANEAQTLEGFTDRLQAATDRYGDSLQDLPDHIRDAFASRGRAAIAQAAKELAAERQALMSEVRAGILPSDQPMTLFGAPLFDEAYFDNLTQAKQQLETFQRVLEDTNDPVKAFAESGIDPRQFQVAADGIGEASDKLASMRTQLEIIEGKKLPAPTQKQLDDTRSQVELLERMAQVADAAERARLETRARASQEARDLRLTTSATDELVKLREREAAAVDQIARLDEAEAKRKSADEAVRALEREAAIERELSGIRDQAVRARREAALRAEAEGRSLDLSGDALAKHVSLSLQIHDARARIVKLDEASAEADDRREKALQRQLEGLKEVASIRERMNSDRTGAERDIRDRQALVDAQRSGLKVGPHFVDQMLARERDRQSLRSRLDVDNNPAMERDFSRLLPDVDKLSTQEQSLERVVAILRQLEPETSRIGRDMDAVNEAFAAGALDVHQHADALRLLQGELRATNEAMHRQQLEQEAMGGGLEAMGAGFELSLRRISDSAHDTSLFWDSAFASMADTGEELFRGALRGTADWRDSLSRLAEDLAILTLKMLALKAIAAAMGTTPPGQTAGAAPAGSAGGGGGFWGTLGQVVGTAAGAYFGGPQGAQMGGQLGAAAGGAVGGGGGGGGTQYPASYNSQTGMYGRAARGQVYDLGVFRRYARGGTMPDIIDRPTAFPMSRGIGLAGDGTRPEAILPLHRDAQGKLGVGAKAANTNTVNLGGVTVNMQSSGDPAADKAAAEAAAKAMREQLDRFVTERLTREMRGGGMLHRRYG